MDNASYVTLTRQSGLMAEMRAVANNIANLSTTGFRREGVIFAEYVSDTGQGAAPLSMANADARRVDLTQASLTGTGATFDFAIDGPGFFLIETPDGNALTRAGSFTPSPDGELVTPDGHRLLDAGGAPVFVPLDGPIHLAADGTLSAGTTPIALIGLWQPDDPAMLVHRGGTSLTTEGGISPVEGSRLVQGSLESSNVNPITEIARMIEVQRAYEVGQTFLDREDQRVRGVISTLAR